MLFDNWFNRQDKTHNAIRESMGDKSTGIPKTPVFFSNRRKGPFIGSVILVSSFTILDS